MSQPFLSDELFVRKSKLTSQQRFLLSYIATYQNEHGTITRLAHKYDVSRKYIYVLRNELRSRTKKLADLDKKDKKEEIKKSLELLLSLRFEGKCSTEGISTVLNRLTLPNNSVGFISEKLRHLGHLIGNHLTLESPNTLHFVFCSDEIFAKKQPILIVVDPISLLILRIELCENHQQLSWEKLWNNLLSQGYTPLSICKDEGASMKAAQAVVFPDTPVQSDTFHAVSHRLGAWCIRFRTKAYAAIKAEYEALSLLNKAKKEHSTAKREQQYKVAQQEALTAIELYESFNWLYHCLLSCLESFDNQGKLKIIEQMQGDFETALILMQTLGQEKVNEEIQHIHACKKDLFYFMEVAKSVVSKLAEEIELNTAPSKVEDNTVALV